MESRGQQNNERHVQPRVVGLDLKVSVEGLDGNVEERTRLTSLIQNRLRDIVIVDNVWVEVGELIKRSSTEVGDINYYWMLTNSGLTLYAQSNS